MIEPAAQSFLERIQGAGQGGRGAVKEQAGSPERILLAAAFRGFLTSSATSFASPLEVTLWHSSTNTVVLRRDVAQLMLPRGL